MDKIGAGAFLVGVILLALGLTVVPSSELVLVGFLIGAAGVVIMYFALKSG